MKVVVGAVIELLVGFVVEVSNLIFQVSSSSSSSSLAEQCPACSTSYCNECASKSISKEDGKCKSVDCYEENYLRKHITQFGAADWSFGNKMNKVCFVLFVSH